MRQADIERRLANMARAARCGAKTRTGHPCGQAAVEGLERLATSDKTTLVIERQPDGKMRVTSGSWDEFRAPDPSKTPSPFWVPERGCAPVSTT
jgi:hypothetical protein